MASPDWKILSSEGSARSGELTLSHGKVQTPVFMPVGTYGAVKTLSPTELRTNGTQILLGNTYHLYLRPGLELLTEFGGLHDFMGWKGPILTDSGGFQVFSLGNLKTIDDDGVSFRSHLDGQMIRLTPEICANIQRVIGSDIAMVLDECVSLPNTPEVLKRAVERSYFWAKRFLKEPRLPGQKVFGIVQGGTDINLRKDSLSRSLDLPLDGLAIGGLSVGESHEAMVEVLHGLQSKLPEALPHYLMGVGTPLDILEAVRSGIDMFDCVLPTRNARNAYFFTSHGPVNIRNSEHKNSKDPIHSECSCECCQSYSRAYLRHLFQTKEILGCRLATIHNVHYYHAFMQQIRSALERSDFETFYRKWQPKLSQFYAHNGKGSIE